MSEFHFIRPWGFLLFLPLGWVAWRALCQAVVPQGWQRVCDSHLLPYLIQHSSGKKRTGALIALCCSVACLIIALSGPTWSRYPVPTYQSMQARVFVLDLSDAMLATDVKPSRLERAKFKLHDVLEYPDIGQFGLVVYSGEPFVVSPLTDDGQTIDALLAVLTPGILPVKGHNLDAALEEAAQLITQAEFKQGDILVLSSHAPSAASIETAQVLANQGIYTSIMPILPGKAVNPLFQHLATEGKGQVLRLSDHRDEVERWLDSTRTSRQLGFNVRQDMPVWRDQGRWFVLPALILLLPVFRRGWLQRVGV